MKMYCFVANDMVCVSHCMSNLVIITDSSCTQGMRKTADSSTHQASFGIGQEARVHALQCCEIYLRDHHAALLFVHSGVVQLLPNQDLAISNSSNAAHDSETSCCQLFQDRVPVAQCRSGLNRVSKDMRAGCGAQVDHCI
jgi:hypothetical protein